MPFSVPSILNETRPFDMADPETLVPTGRPIREMKGMSCPCFLPGWLILAVKSKPDNPLIRTTDFFKSRKPLDGVLTGI